MIERENLKKGDRVLVVGPDTECERAMVVSVGKKYIGVQLDDDEGPCGVVKGLCGAVIRFNNDEHMEEADWSARRLFLGTVEELKQARAEREAAMEAWKDIDCKLSQSMPPWKLIGMKAVMDSPTLEEAERKVHELFIHELLK